MPRMGPAGGQGMKTRMPDALHPARKLAVACPPARPDPVPHSHHNPTHTAQQVRNILARLLFGLAPVRRAMVDTMTEVSIGYHDSPLNGGHAGHLPGPGPGERMPPVVAQPPIGAGHTPRFALCADPSDA